jgi:hypothetical protein
MRLRDLSPQKETPHVKWPRVLVQVSIFRVLNESLPNQKNKKKREKNHMQGDQEL